MIAMETIEKLSKEKLPMITVLAGEDLGQYSQAKEKFLKALRIASVMILMESASSLSSGICLILLI